MILIGQGGSGKLFVVKHVVVPTLQWSFPVPAKDSKRFLVVAHSNAQANGISCQSFRAETAHSAGCIRVQGLSNAALRPGKKINVLRQKWERVQALITEEAYLMPASIFNMLHIRASWGRKQSCGVDMSTSQNPEQSFGYIPFCLLLGDPLQLRPRGIGLLTDLREARKQGVEIHVEQEQSIKLHKLFPEVFMLRGTKRFQDKDLPALLDCLRASRALPPALWSKLQRQFCSTDDLEERLWQPLWLGNN